MEKGSDLPSYPVSNAAEDESLNPPSEAEIAEKPTDNGLSVCQDYSTENSATKDDKSADMEEIAFGSDSSAHMHLSMESGDVKDGGAGKDKSLSPLDDKVLEMNTLAEKADSSDRSTETGSGRCSSPVFDSEVLDMIEMAEKTIIVLSMHLNDSCEGKLDRNRVKMVSIALLNIVSFVNSADAKQKLAFVNGLLTKTLILEGLGAYFMQHWTGITLGKGIACHEVQGYKLLSPYPMSNFLSM